MQTETTQERFFKPLVGWGPLLIDFVGLFGGVALVIYAIANQWALGTVWMSVLAIVGSLVLLFSFISLFGFLAVQPNDARVLLLFGSYVGTIKQSGFFWVNPFYSKKHVSLRIRNFETGSHSVAEKKNETGVVVQAKTRTHGRPSKVNDRDGNPIEISAVVVWRVVNTAEALFEVDDYEDYVGVQSEAALRNLASRHPYDSHDHEVSLRSSTQEVSDQLRHDIQDRLNKAGVEVIEARISHLAYAPEIAAAMLQRQQASAVVAARTKIVEGAVGMVQQALEHLSRDNIVELDDERKAAMVSNLLVVLCSDRHAQPVINTGTLHQ
ncbi:MAG: SPFH domain-containing protein [Planctomycetes bacterium]|nr:SPFH domain-containing protein [Planctomycetota bacterium]